MQAHPIAEDAGEIKALRKKSTPEPDRWYKRYPDVYRRGTRKLSLAARGAYSDILDLIYMADGPIEDDDFAIACELRVKQRVWMRARKELFSAGKLVSRDGHISNPKADEVLAEREAQKAAKRAPSVTKSIKNNDGQKKLLQGKLSVINGGRTTEAEAEIEEDRKDGEVAAVAMAASALMDLGEKLYEAGGSAIDPSMGGFLNLGTPRWWLEQGCCLERDVLPVIRAICSRKRYDKLISWDYFTKAVTAAKHKREQPLPEIDMHQERGGRRNAKADANAAMAAILKQRSTQ